MFTTVSFWILALSLAALAILLWMFIARARGDRSLENAEYDERQVAARGKAYRDGFYTLLIANLLLYFCADSLPGSPGEWFLGALCLGLAAAIISCVARDAYTGLHQNPFPYAIVLALMGAADFITYYDGMTRGKLSLTSLFTALTMMTPLAALLLRRAARPKEDEEE